MKIVNPKTGELIKNYNSLTPEQKSALLGDVNFYQRSMKKVENFIKDDIKKISKDKIDKMGLGDSFLFGHHKVTFSGRPYFNVRSMNDKDTKVYEDLKTKYTKMRNYVIIK